MCVPCSTVTTLFKAINCYVIGLENRPKRTWQEVVEGDFKK